MVDGVIDVATKSMLNAGAGAAAAGKQVYEDLFIHLRSAFGVQADEVRDWQLGDGHEV
jgi:hypothetical protein